MEKPVTFVNRNNCKLFGMLYLPDAAVSRHVGIVISVNAVKYRLGTFRLHTLLARKLCELGYYVFSFDPQGIGDSEGEFPYKLINEHYYDIQTGKYSEDLQDACDYFTAECALDSLLLLGLCGGAISVLIEAATDPRIDGLVLLNIPVFVEDMRHLDRENNAAKITSMNTAVTLLEGKLSRLREPAFWRRLVTLQVDLAEEGRLVRKAVIVVVQKGWRKVIEKFARRSESFSMSGPVSKNPLFSMHFQRAFAEVMAGGKQVLFIFAELDPWTGIFKSEFQELVLTPGNAFEKNYSYVEIGAANHIFSGTNSQKQLEKNIVDWLQVHYRVEQRREDVPAGHRMAQVVGDVRS